VQALSVSEYSASVNWPGWAVEGNADRHEEAAGGNCNWFQRRSGLGSTAEAHLEAKSQLARKRRILNPRYGANFNGMTRRASGRFRCSAVQMPSERWRAGPVGSTSE
jgi:hypothetical protein